MQRLRFSDLGVPPHLPHTHVTRLTGSQITSPHVHDFYEVFLVIDGAGTHHLNGRQHELTAGHLVALRPSDGHWFSTDPGTRLSFVNVAVSTVWWDSFHALFGLPAWSGNESNAILKPADVARLGAVLGKTYSDADALAFVQAWQELRTYLSPAKAPIAPPPPDWLEAVRQDLAAMPQALSESISFWQRRSGCSPEHLSRTCRRYYGMTFRELINAARIERAKFLLRTTDRKVISVAFDCGFANMANFHRTFARLAGCTPNSWRRLGNTAVPLDSRGASLD